jgi:myo-inositol 2-dehydrogenase/D-chiro-inositol 1-dehydrogenase
LKRVKFAVLSAAHVHTDAYVRAVGRNPDAELIGLFDDDGARAAEFAQRHGIRAFDSAEELFGCGPDVAIVCAENTRHADYVRMAAERGVDALCEKPLGVDRDDMLGMLDFCDKRGVKLMTALCNRYIGAFREAEAAVKGGRIGELIAVFATNKGTMPGMWFTDRALSGGGCVIDHTVHVADLMNHMLSAVPEAVFARAGHNLFQMDVEDCAVVTLRYPGNVLVTLDASWSRTPSFPYGRDLTLRFIGTRGSIFVDYFAESNRIYAPGERIQRYFGEDKDQWIIDDLVRCYQTGRPFPITGRDGYRAAIVAEAAYRSIASGQEVSL